MRAGSDDGPIGRPIPVRVGDGNRSFAVFAEYESLVRARVGSGGASRYAGGFITPNLPIELDVVVDRVITLDLTAGQAAAMFWRNPAWGEDAVTQGLISDWSRISLLARLRARKSDQTRGLFTWTHRQVVARRGAA